MEYNRTWPLAMRYGTHNYGGLELKDPSTEAVIKKIKYIQDLFYKTDSSKSVNLLISWYQHVSGLSTPILETSHQATTYINSIWLTNLIVFFHKHNLQIKFKQTFIQKPQRTNDRFIMDNITLHISSPNILKKINACRLYLQVTLLLEIATIRGDEVIFSAITGERNISQHSNYQWPKQKRPDTKTWKLWHNTISTIYFGEKLLKLQSVFHLSRWILPPSKRSTNYHFQLSPLIQNIYIYNCVTISHHLTTTMN